MANSVPTTTSPDEPKPIEKRASELQADRDWIQAGWSILTLPAQVLSVHPYTDDEGPSVLIVFAPSDGQPLSDILAADEVVPLATEEQVAAAKAIAYRQGIAAQLGRIADLIDTNDLPMPRMGLDISISVGSAADVVRAGQILDIEPETTVVGTAVVSQVSWPPCPDHDERYHVHQPPVEITWRSYERTEPKPAPAAITEVAQPEKLAGPVGPVDTGLDFSREPDAATATPVPAGVEGRPFGKRTPTKARP